ncbi:MAG: cation transporter [Polyangiaceae bacterium]|nr:cation transporter [Polyangiaceae bacterium]
MHIRNASILAGMAAIGSVLLAGGLWLAHHEWGSELALAQASDSAMDVLGGILLLVALTAHRWWAGLGRERMESCAALALSVLAILLGVEVAQGSVQVLRGAGVVVLDGLLLVPFLAKVLFKAWVWSLCGDSGSPAMTALKLDARNDVLVGLVATMGFFAARLGSPSVDAWVALPLAAYIIWGGVDLARENLNQVRARAPGH